MSTSLPPSPFSPATEALPDNIQIEKLLIEWTSPARPYKTRSREFYSTIVSIVFLLGIILLLLQEFLLIGVIIAFAFLAYVLATNKPNNVIHQITTKGIRTDHILYDWSDLTNFWLKKQWDQEVIICQTKKALPGIILMVIDDKKRKDIIKTLGDKIPLEKPLDSFVDRASQWLGDKIPLENT